MSMVGKTRDFIRIINQLKENVNSSGDLSFPREDLEEGLKLINVFLQLCFDEEDNHIDKYIKFISIPNLFINRILPYISFHMASGTEREVLLLLDDIENELIDNFKGKYPYTFKLHDLIKSKEYPLKEIMNTLYSVIYKEIFINKNYKNIDNLIKHVKEETFIIISHGEKLNASIRNSDYGYNKMMNDIMNLRQYLYMVKIELVEQKNN